MSFYQKYELMKLVSSGEPKTFQARETSTGRIVHLHLLGSLDAARRAALVEELKRRRATQARPEDSGVYDLETASDAPYVATPELPPGATLWTWLSEAATPKPAAPSPPAPAPLPGEVGGSEFTRMFLSGPALAQPPMQPQAPPAAPAVRPPAPPPPAAASEPGEFTRQFMSLSAPPAPPAAPVPAAPAQSAAPEPGEFTRQFQVPVAPAPPPPAPPAPPQAMAPPPPAPPPLFAMPDPARVEPPPPPQQAPGEFTRIFGQKAFSAPAPPPVAATPPPPPAAPAAAAPPLPPISTGSMEMFSTPPLQTPITPLKPVGQPASSSLPTMLTPTPQPPAPAPSLFAPPAPAATPVPQSPAAPPTPGEFTKFFASPLGASSLPLEQAEKGQLPAPPPASAKPFSGPGEFTRMFGRPGVQAQSQNPPTAPLNERPATGTFCFGGAAPAPPPPQQQIHGPGEFTRMFESPSAGFSSYTPPTPAPPQASAPPPPPPRRSSSALNGILIAVASAGFLGLVLYAVYMAFGSK